MCRAVLGVAFALIIACLAGCGSHFSQVGGVTIDSSDVRSCQNGGQYQLGDCRTLANQLRNAPEGRVYALKECQLAGQDQIDDCMNAWERIGEYDPTARAYLADRAAAEVAKARQDGGSNDSNYFYFDQSLRDVSDGMICFDSDCVRVPYGHHQSIALAAAALSDKSDKAFIRDAARVAYCENQGVKLACDLTRALGGQVSDPAATQAKIETYEQKLADWDQAKARKIGLSVADNVQEQATDQRETAMILQGVATGLANSAASAAAYAPPPSVAMPMPAPRVAEAEPQSRNGYILAPAAPHPIPAPTVGRVTPSPPSQGPGIGCPAAGACQLASPPSAQNGGASVNAGYSGGGTVVASNPGSGGLPPPNPANYRAGLPACVAVTSQPNGGTFNLTLANNCGQSVHVYTSDAGSGPLGIGQTGHMIASPSPPFQMAVCPEGFSPVGAGNFPWVPGQQYRCWNGAR